MPLFTAGSLGLVGCGLGLVRYFGLGLKNLVLFTSLACTANTDKKVDYCKQIMCQHSWSTM